MVPISTTTGTESYLWVTGTPELKVATYSDGTIIANNVYLRSTTHSNSDTNATYATWGGTECKVRGTIKWESPLSRSASSTGETWYNQSAGWATIEGALSVSASNSIIYDASSATWMEAEAKLSPRDRLRAAIKNRLRGNMPAPAIIRRAPISEADIREARARATLRKIVGEKQFANFLRNGFVTIRNPKSGYTYVIPYNSNNLTRVYKDGKLVERLCIHLRHGFTPTDFVITMCLMAFNNDKDIWKVGIKHGFAHRNTVYERKAPNDEEKSLAELFNQFKKVG
jgi:hypothetical protein